MAQGPDDYLWGGERKGWTVTVTALCLSGGEVAILECEATE